MVIFHTSSYASLPEGLPEGPVAFDLHYSLAS